MNQSPDQLTLFVVDSHAKIYQWPAAAQDWLESEADYGLSTIALLQALGRDGLLSKTSPACYPATTAKILPSSFVGWSSAGMASHGGYLTLNISDWPNGGNVCSLSEVLETDAPPKYYLSAKAARGILRRAEKRGRELPHSLQAALEQVAQETHEPKPK